jgi:hypothetical protein
MRRERFAIVLGVVAVLAVLGTAAVAIGSYVDRDAGREPDPVHEAGTLTVGDPATGASFEVPSGRWQVEDRSVRIYYADDQDRPVAVVRGPAVYRAGYCAEQPKGSHRAFAGFTRDSFEAWVRGVTGGDPAVSTGTSREQVTLADGTSATLTRTALFLTEDEDPCTAGAVEIVMVRAGGVRVVLVRDDLEDGGLPHEDVEAVLTTLTAS